MKESSLGGACAGQEEPAPPSTRMHGRQLACFRPKRRFRLATAAQKTEDVELACHCEHQVLQCLVDIQQYTERELDTAEDFHKNRMRKWSERFVTRDWAQERVCQKWKENQKRFTEQEEDALEEDLSSTKATTKTVKMAFSTLVCRHICVDRSGGCAAAQRSFDVKPRSRILRYYIDCIH
ncbi:hypothetical protein PPTG_18472 [Phytophthora nicotianae INRA-310]|uniref:Uncharacterized protein n=1 Tax=Phytophthora nicotianae (strain INRA-310) TaxID=761204 RepID=W2PF69_PHYN3|nr:hypothetical protein PPTG_18472 [Phytophthora nicotianae INRA-310]ETM99697.1 hypothetical protein PPTG_18472 [Phytophthora nicotianae INRA-310]